VNVLRGARGRAGARAGGGRKLAQGGLAGARTEPGDAQSEKEAGAETGEPQGRLGLVGGQLIGAFGCVDVIVRVGVVTVVIVGVRIGGVRHGSQGVPHRALPCQGCFAGAVDRPSSALHNQLPMRLAGFLVLASLGTVNVASADPPKEVTGGGTTTVTVPPAQPLDSNPPAPGRATMWTQIATRTDVLAAPLSAGAGSDATQIAGGVIGLAPPLSLGLFGGSGFLSGRFSLMSSQLSLRPPAILGIAPLLAVGYSQLLTGPTGTADIGASYANGPLHVGWQLHLAQRFDQTGGRPLLTSTSYARFVMPRWDFGVDHLAQFSTWGGAFRTTTQYLNVSAGVKPSSEAPTVRAGTTIPLRPVATPSSRLSLFGTF
jgi:hypothetical protein